MIHNSNDEDCLDPEALLKRNFPGDQLIKMAHAIGFYVEEMIVPKELYDEAKEWFGDKFPNILYTAYGKTKLKRGN